MHKGLSFLLVLILTTLAWVILGFVLRLFFTSLSLLIFLVIGLVAGVFLASVLALVHEDTVSVVVPQPKATDPEAVPPPALRPRVERPGVERPNAGLDPPAQA